MSVKNITKIDYFTTVKTLQNEKSKDMKISELNIKLKKLSTEINRLSKENSDLKMKYSLIHDVHLQLKSAEETIKDLREQNLKLMLEHKNKESELGKNIDKILIEKKKEKLKSDKNETLYMQKMYMANQIELENKIYKEELTQLKKQMELNEGNAKNKINQLEINNLIRYNILKKRILNNLNETKSKLANLNLKFMDNNNRTTNLQNYQLLIELEAQKQENEQLIKENEILNKKLIEIKGALDIHQKVEYDLAEKIKKIKVKNNILDNSNKLSSFSSSSIVHKNKVNNNGNDNMDIIFQKLKKIKILNENEKNKNLSNKNKRATHKLNRTQIDYTFLNNKNFLLRNRDLRDIKDVSEVSVTSKLLSDERLNSNQEYNIIPDENIMLKFKNVTDEKKYINLFNYLEKCLENFYADVKNGMNNMKNNHKIKIDFESLKKLKFNEFSKKEQYILLILLMNHILPLIYVYFSTNSNKNIDENNLFKTDLNLNYKILNKIYAQSSNIIKKAFISKDNKLSVELCMNKLGETIRRKNLSVTFLDKKQKFLQ